MPDQPDHKPGADLPQRVDHALAAFWRGQPDELEHLVNPSGTAGPHVGEMLDQLRGGASPPVTGLPCDCAIPGYQITRELGRGGMGVVYEAKQEEPKRRVALKVFGGLAADEYRLRCFRKEIELQAPLRHPAIATLYAAGRTPDGRPFFTMELVNGEPLNQYVERLQLSLPARLELFLQICDAVEYAHKHKVLHRDLKPGNILVDTEGQPRILDFGLAKMTDADVTATITLAGTDHVAGTLAYMSPEQARGRVREIGKPSDVYSLGVILYELVTGQLPYELDQVLPHEALRVIQEQIPCRPSALYPVVRGDLETIVLKALEKDVTPRYQTAGDLREDIRRYLAAEPILARRPSRLYVLHKRLIRHRSAAKVAAIVLVVSLIGTTGGLAWRHARELRGARQQVLGAMESLETGEVEQGFSAASRVFERHPDLPEARLVMAQAAFRCPGGGDRHQAIRILHSEVQRDSGRWECAALLAEIHRVNSSPGPAEQHAALAQRGMPDTARGWYLRSLTALETLPAVVFAREAVNRPAADALAWQRFTNLCLLTNDLEGAMRGAEVLIGIGKHAFRWQLIKCNLLLRAGQSAEALALYDAVIRANKVGYVYRAHAHRQSGDYARAVEDYTTAIRLSETTQQHAQSASELPTQDRSGSAAGPEMWAYYHRATALWMLGEVSAAIADCERIQPTLGRPFYSDARLYVMLRDARCDENAEAVLTRALAEVPGNGPWLREIFRCLDGQTTPDELVSNALASANPVRCCEAWYYAGEVQRLAGNLDRARESFEQCVHTRMPYDPNRPLEPMSEYELARWRLKQLSADPTAPTSARVDD